MTGTDPSERARPADREAAIDLIEAAFSAGRIGSADRTIRKNNVAAAGTLGELDLVTRDLVTRDPARPALPDDPWPDEPLRDEPLPVDIPEPVDISVSRPVPAVHQRRPVRPLLWVLFVVVDLAVVAGLFLTGAVGPGVELGDDDDAAGVVEVEPAENRYDLSAEGIGDAIAAYAERFGTSRALGATFYDAYAIFEVPVGDWTSHTRWILRDGSWTQMTDAQVNTPFQRWLDLGRLDVAALVHNIGRARRSLAVDRPETVYAIVGYDPFSEGPAVSVHVAGPDGRSGHLVTTVDGQLLRRHPWGE